MRIEYHFYLLDYYTAGLNLQNTVRSADFKPGSAPPLPIGLFTEAAAQRRSRSVVRATPDGDVIRVILPLIVEKEGLTGFLVAGRRTTAPIKNKMADVAKGLGQYRQLKRIHDPIRVNHYIALTIVALLSIFVSTWIGFHLAKSITGPIMGLAEGTERIAHGDYDFTIDELPRDREMATLIDSFNRMTRDLKASKAQLTQKNIELQGSNTELDQRRRYMEIILQNVAAGVVSADAQDRVTTINKSAREILMLEDESAPGRPYREVLPEELTLAMDGLMRAAKYSYRGSAERQIRIRAGGQDLSLHLFLTLLEDDNGQELGMLIVFDDLSELEKAQRMAAWREVARRIAHEIKNPLTPIQLSTQRLRRRYAHLLADDESQPCLTSALMMIIRQVDELKRLVGEFSNFARMPEASPTPNDLGRIVDETLIMYYEEAHRQLEFVFNGATPNLPAFQPGPGTDEPGL